MQGGLIEQDVGVTEFLASPSAFERISGIIKARYSDFNVYEIDKNGVVIHLTDLGPGNSWDTLRQHVAAKKSRQDQEVCTQHGSACIEGSREMPMPSSGDARQLDSNGRPEKSVSSVDEGIREHVHSFFSSTFGEMAGSLTESLIELIEKKRLAGETFLMLPSVEEKQARTRIHDYFKELSTKVGSVLVTDTLDRNRIRVSYHFQSGRKRRQHVDGRLWPETQSEGRANYIICHLYKENKDTMECSSRIANVLRYCHARRSESLSGF
jgi:tRNA pseudouridine13 synthase